MATAVWRLLNLETFNGFMNMAIDEAILRARIDNVVPDTLRLYCWKPSAVSVGRFQALDDQLHLENCRRRGVDVVRRISGGGTVFHDQEGEVTYSVVVDKESLTTPGTGSVYKKVYDGLAEALKILGLKADFNEGNVKTCPNMLVTSRKISGSAQCHKKGVVLQHGTLLLDVDLEKMFTFLRVPWAADSRAVLEAAKRKITSMKMELGREVSINEVEEAVIRGFQQALDMKPVEGELTGYEDGLCKKLCKEKYMRDEWNYSLPKNH